MARATTATEPSYTLTIHRRALPSWRDLPDAVRADLRAVLEECARLRRPTTHAKVALMRDCKMFRIRKGDYRVLCDKDGPDLRVLAVDRREYIYDKTQVAKRRASDQ